MKREGYSTWGEFFMGVAQLAAQRSKDPSTQVGACIVKDNKIVGVGYNGFPNHIPDDAPASFPWEPNVDPVKSKYSYVVHAELNAILNAPDLDKLRGATMYCTLAPCNECAKAIIQCGIIKIVVASGWRDTPYHVTARKMLCTAYIPVFLGANESEQI